MKSIIQAGVLCTNAKTISHIQNGSITDHSYTIKMFHACWHVTEKLMGNWDNCVGNWVSCETGSVISETGTTV